MGAGVPGGVGGGGPPAGSRTRPAGRHPASLDDRSDCAAGRAPATTGRLDEAAQLFEGAEPHPRALVGLGYIALDHGVVSSALAAACRAVRSIPGPMEHTRSDRLAPLELLVHALAAAGDSEEAAEALGQLKTMAALVSTPPVLASVAFHTGLVAFAGGEPDLARASFEDARDLFVRCQARPMTSPWPRSS